jgi:hypothetical protein
MQYYRYFTTLKLQDFQYNSVQIRIQNLAQYKFRRKLTLYLSFILTCTLTVLLDMVGRPVKKGSMLILRNDTVVPQKGYVQYLRYGTSI